MDDCSPPPHLPALVLAFRCAAFHFTHQRAEKEGTLIKPQEPQSAWSSGHTSTWVPQSPLGLTPGQPKGLPLPGSYRSPGTSAHPATPGCWTPCLQLLCPRLQASGPPTPVWQGPDLSLCGWLPDALGRGGQSQHSICHQGWSPSQATHPKLEARAPAC